MAKERYKNLPGVKVNYNDGNLYATNQKLSSTTRSLLIIAGAADGPVGEPIPVNTIGIKEADKLFGGINKRYKDAEGKVVSEPVQGSLVRSMYEALDAGCDDIRLLRMGGKKAKTEIYAKRTAEDVVIPILGLTPGNKDGIEVNLGLGADDLLVSVDEIKVYDVADLSTTIATFNTDLQDFFYEDLTNPLSTDVLTLKADKFPAKVQLSIEITYEKRSEIDSDDGTGDSFELATYISTIPGHHRFETANNNWVPGSATVVIRDIADPTIFEVIPMGSSVDSNKLYWNYGTPVSGTDYSNITTPSPDNAEEDGGIFFTQHFFQRVDAGDFGSLDPQDETTTQVYIEYKYYESSTEVEEVASTPLEGHEVKYTYTAEALSPTFKITYKNGNNALGSKVVLDAPKYSHSYVLKEVVLDSDVAAYPFDTENRKGYTLSAEYKSADGPAGDATLVIESIFGGSVYGSLLNPVDEMSISGVQVFVASDSDNPGHKIIKFKKPFSKQLFSKDEYLNYYTKNLPLGVKTTIKDFVDFVNNDKQNNIVELSAPSSDYKATIVELKNVAGIYLGQNIAPGGSFVYNASWAGNDGVYDIKNSSKMKELYLELGGEYSYTEEEDGTRELVLSKPGVYSKLENYMVDQILLTDVYANTLIGDVETSDSKLSFATQLAQHCAVSTAKSWETIGFIGVAPNPSATLGDIQEYVMVATGRANVNADIINKYKEKGINAKYRNNHYMYDEVTSETEFNEEGNPIDIGNYVSVVYGPEVAVVSDKIGTYVTSGAAVYAGFVSALRPEVSSTNKQINSVLGLRYILSESQHNLLVGGRYVTLQQKTSNNLSKSVYIKDGVTSAQPLSDYNRLSTVRIIHAVVQVVREKADPFIGLPNGLAQRNALSAQIQNALDTLKDQGVIQKFNFTIFSSAEDRVLGNAFIKLEVVPQFETRKFYTSVVLRAN
jgi:hypothetical protein